jgi:hypothetical protein
VAIPPCSSPVYRGLSLPGPGGAGRRLGGAHHRSAAAPLTRW